jgi:translation initiation factor 2 beta subunit (eIF-2beta)/eIF-5
MLYPLLLSLPPPIASYRLPSSHLTLLLAYYPPAATMTTINIAGLTPVDDPSYRYQMPRLIGKVEGRGNGIKTVLVNISELASSLNREAPEITKFFGCEVGSQTTYAADTDRAIVNGAHIDTDLQTHLKRYIENFVLCKNCRLPETHYKIKDGTIIVYNIYVYNKCTCNYIYIYIYIT